MAMVLVAMVTPSKNQETLHPWPPAYCFSSGFMQKVITGYFWELRDKSYQWRSTFIAILLDKASLTSLLEDPFAVCPSIKHADISIK